ncbi:DUF2303 family protein [Lampropedia aestuarii]|uniref:DUF2303 family protein n=1 Tax=Lampropedia aestuarii TaxID=2562762 RepID=UPI0024690B8A|nr:DUF2303 family protein [Lampropedia aestuarii]MDH5857771.1 DUF2303 family protein [Lampropedia aestuarii]
MDLHETQTETVAKDVLAACNQETHYIDNVPFVVLPEGFKANSLEGMLCRPARKRGTTVLNDAASFISMVLRQKNEATLLFSTISPPSFTAVFNSDCAEEDRYSIPIAGWGDHRATYNAPLSPEWGEWTKADKKQMNQVEMAQFLEANMVDVAYIPADLESREPGSPDGATLLEICRTLEAKKKVNFKSSVRLPDGSTQFTYDEDVAGSAVNGTMEIPAQFSIGVPVFENGENYRQDVHFRYRIQDGGKLVMWIELIRPHKVIEDAVKQLRAHIAEATGLQVLNGTAPAAR